MYKAHIDTIYDDDYDPFAPDDEQDSTTDEGPLITTSHTRLPLLTLMLPPHQRQMKIQAFDFPTTDGSSAKGSQMTHSSPICLPLTRSMDMETSQYLGSEAQIRTRAPPLIVRTTNFSYHTPGGSRSSNG